MKNIHITAVSIGGLVNLGLFFAKLYVGISSNSLAVYCDAINNLGDTFACIIGIIGFIFAKKDRRKKTKEDTEPLHIRYQHNNMRNRCILCI